jgi:hypothetical protein
MRQDLKSIIRKGEITALAGLLSLAVGCASAPKPQQKAEQPKDTKPKAELIIPAPERAPMNPLFIAGKSLDDYFKEFSQLNPDQKVVLAKSLNNLSVWETVLLSRYVPIDSTLRGLSSFYSTDYKGYLQNLLSVSGLNPTIVGQTGDKGLGQLSTFSENWARSLYFNKKLGYKFTGLEITDNPFDINTNLILSSILFRKDAEEKVVDLDAVYALYSYGLKGVKLNKDNLYVANETGLNAVNRAELFDSIADNLMIFSWISMENPDLKKYIDDSNLRKVIENNNNNSYEGKAAYEGMINFLNAISTNSKKYSDENSKMFRTEANNIFLWTKMLYGN